MIDIKALNEAIEWDHFTDFEINGEKLFIENGGKKLPGMKAIYFTALEGGAKTKTVNKVKGLYTIGYFNIETKYSAYDELFSKDYRVLADIYEMIENVPQLNLHEATMDYMYFSMPVNIEGSVFQKTFSPMVSDFIQERKQEEEEENEWANKMEEESRKKEDDAIQKALEILKKRGSNIVVSEETIVINRGS